MDIDKKLQSVVIVEASVPEDAFTAQGLGTERAGSGVVIRENGLVVTIGYLITEASDVSITTRDGRTVPAHPLAYDQETGFGLVQALGDLGLPALELGDSKSARTGDPVVIVGGQGSPVRAEIVARQEFAGYWEYLLEDAIFSSPAHPSWGGAALVAADGKLIGIGSLRLQMATAGRVQDINMSVPIDLLKPILKKVLDGDKIGGEPRPWLGLYSGETDDRVVALNVDARGPAAAAGMEQGDIIADVRNEEVGGLADFYRKVWASGPPGTELPLRIIRDGRDQWIRIKTGDRNDLLKKPVMQ